MKKIRIIKNTIMIGLVVAFAGASALTMNFIGDSPKGAAPTFSDSSSTMNSPSDMNLQGSGSDSNSGDSTNLRGGQPPQMQNGNNQNGQPPQMPDNQNGNSDNSGNSDDSGNSDNNGFVPDNNGNSNNSNSDNNSNNNQGGFQPDNNGNSNDNSQNGNSNNDNFANGQGGFQPDNNKNGNGGFKQGNRPDFKEQSPLLIFVKYGAIAFDSLVIGVLVMYLILSRFNKKGFKESLKGTKRILIFILCSLVIASALAGTQIAATEILTHSMMGSHQGARLPNGNNSNNAPFANNQSTDVSASGKTTVTSTKTLSDNYSSTSSDESAVLVENGGKAKISGAKVTKSGDSTNTENSEFYGINSGVLVTKNSTATIKNADISTSSKGSNAVFSTGENSKIYVKDTKITTTGSSSARGLDATYGGYIEADNVTINTKGGSCAALATDRGEGTVKVKNSDLTTNGAGSPVIYSTGDISVTDTKGTANGSQMAVIEGKNSATVTSSTLTASAAGNRNNVDNAGVMIYQSMSGDASKGKGTFTAKNSSLSIQKSSKYYKTAPMFFVTNTDAEINLTNTKLNFGSGTLIDAEGTSEWGNSGSNGGNVTLNANNQTLSGDIKADKISTVTINLKNSTYKGTINGGKTAKKVTLTLDKNSKITLTGDTYVTSLKDSDSGYSNINLNGYKLYVNGKALK